MTDRVGPVIPGINGQPLGRSSRVHTGLPAPRRRLRGRQPGRGRRKAAGLLIFAVLAVVTAGCAQKTSVSVTFDDARGLEPGVPVYLGQEKVGEVDSLTTAGDVVEAALSLDPELTSDLRDGSAALLTTRDAHAVIELYNHRSGSEPLENGDRLVGLDGPLELAAWQAGEALDTGRKSVDEMSRSVSEYFESDEWRRQKEEMNRRLESLRQELGRSYDETNKAYREFLKELESQSEGAREKARESYARLVEQLREQIERLKEQGDENIVKPLQDLLDELQRAMERQPRQQEV